MSGWLAFGGTGQVGHDAGTGGQFWVRVGGKMDLSGSHALGSSVGVDGTFRARDTTTVALTHAGSASPSTYNLKFFQVANGGVLEVASGVAFNLTGTYFRTFDGTSTLQPTASLNVGNNYLYANGTRSYDSNVDINENSTLNLYVGSSITTANGDHRYYNSEVNLYTPGWYNLTGQGVINLNAGYIQTGYHPGPSTVLFDGEDQTIRFRDYTYGLENQQGGAILSIGQGKLHITGGTTIYARLVMGGIGPGYDYISATWVKLGDGAGGASNLSLDLTVSGTPDPDPYVLYHFIKAATGQFDSPNDPFGNRITKSGAVTNYTVVQEETANQLNLGLDFN